MSETKTKPIHEIRLGRVKAAVWDHSTDKGTRCNVTFAKIYKDKDGHWQTTASFGREDLLPLAEVARLAAHHLWAEGGPTKDSEDEAELA
jgi:hypothetical protein